MKAKVFSTSAQIRFAHCDPAGIVFYPRYFEMINNVVEDWMSSMDWAFSHFITERNEGFPTVSIQCQFMSPCKIGDQLDFELRLLKLGRSSCTVSVTALNAGVPVLKTENVLVYTARAVEEGSIEIPPLLRERMSAYLPQAPVEQPAGLEN